MDFHPNLAVKLFCERPLWTRRARRRALAAPDILLIPPMAPKQIKKMARSGKASSHNKRSRRVKIVAQAKLPTRFGVFTIFGVKGAGPQDEAVALVHGKPGGIKGKVAPLVRVHSQCLTGDVFHSLRCDCRAQLELAL